MELKPEMFKKMLPLPVTLITTIDSNGVHNAAPYSCVMPILRPFDLIAIASALPRDTLKNIRDTNEFVINVMGEPDLGKMMRCAKDYPPEVDELEKANLETFPSSRISPLRIKEAVGWIEAVTEREVLGDNYALIIGKVLFAELNDKYYQDGEFIENPVSLLIPKFKAIDNRKLTISPVH